MRGLVFQIGLLLALSLAEIFPAVQIFREPGNPDGFDTSRFIASQ